MNLGKEAEKRIVALLEGDYESIQDAAKAVLKEAVRLYEDKAKFVVVGQVKWDGEGYVDPEHADRIVVGPFSTVKQAQSAGYSLSYSSSTHEVTRWWLAPVHFGTPADWYKQRQEEAQAVAASDKALPNRVAETRQKLADHYKRMEELDRAGRLDIDGRPIDEEEATP